MDDDIVYKDAEKYFSDMSQFNAREFIDKIKNIDKNDMCMYMIMFNDVLHVSNFRKDLLLFSVSGEHGLRQEDVIEENRHYLKTYLEEIKKENMNFQEYAIQCLMPIRFYFTTEIKEIVEYFNGEVDKLDLSDKEKLRKKFLVHDLLKSKTLTPKE